MTWSALLALKGLVPPARLVKRIKHMIARMEAKLAKAQFAHTSKVGIEDEH